MRKSSRRSDHRIPPRAMSPPRRCTASTRGEYTQISCAGRGAGKKRELGGIELDRQRVAALAVRVRAHRGPDNLDERAQDAILVEALHRVDLARELATDSFDAPRAFRIRAGRCRSAPRRDRRLERAGRGLAASASANDASVNRIPAWCRYLTSARSTTTWRAVSPARSTRRLSPSFSISPAHTAEEQLGHSRLRVGVGERIARRGAHAERVDPSGRATRGRDRVRPLVHDDHVEVLQHRHHVRQQQRGARPVQLQARDAVTGGRALEADREIVALLEHRDVGDGLRRGDVGLVPGRERVAPDPERVEPELLTVRWRPARRAARRANRARSPRARTRARLRRPPACRRPASAPRRATARARRR